MKKKIEKFWDTLFLYVLGSSACEDNNTHLNNLLESTSTNTVNGWTIDCSEGVWTQDEFADCKNWYGWGNDHEVGSIATTLSGWGGARLDFGNCYQGTVKAFLDGQEIGSADALIPHKVVEFDFTPGSVLTMSEYDVAVIQFNNLEIISCPSSKDFNGTVVIKKNQNLRLMRQNLTPTCWPQWFFII